MGDETEADKDNQCSRCGTPVEDGQDLCKDCQEVLGAMSKMVADPRLKAFLERYAKKHKAMDTEDEDVPEWAVAGLDKVRVGPGRIGYGYASSVDCSDGPGKPKTPAEAEALFNRICEGYKVDPFTGAGVKFSSSSIQVNTLTPFGMDATEDAYGEMLRGIMHEYADNLARFGMTSGNMEVPLRQMFERALLDGAFNERYPILKDPKALAGALVVLNTSLKNGNAPDPRLDKARKMATMALSICLAELGRRVGAMAKLSQFLLSDDGDKMETSKKEIMHNGKEISRTLRGSIQNTPFTFSEVEKMEHLLNDFYNILLHQTHVRPDGSIYSPSDDEDGEEEDDEE